MAIFVPRFVRQLRDVLLTAPADGEVLTYDSADEKWKNEAGGGGGGDLTDAVILAPASSARNVIQPTAGAVIAAIVKAHAAQSVDLTQWQDSAGGAVVEISETGAVTIRPSDAVPANYTDVFRVIGTAGVVCAVDSAGQMSLLVRDPAADGLNITDQSGGTSGRLLSIDVAGGVSDFFVITGDSKFSIFTGIPVVQQTAASIGDLWTALQAYGWLDAGSVAPTIGGAPTTVTYITQTPDAGLSAEQALSALATGLVKNTTGTGVLSIAGASDYISPTLYDANTVLAADTNDTPAALTMGASTILARLAAGNIKAATPAELRTLLALVVGTDVQAFDTDLTTIAALADPNADRILFWDDSAGAYTFLTPGTGLTITGTTIDAAGGGGVAWPRKYKTGLYYQTNQAPPADGVTTPVLDRVAFHAFPVGEALTIDRIVCGVSTVGTASSVVRLGIYNDTDGQPDTLLLDAGTVAGDSLGYKEITISQALSAGTLYWIAVVWQVAAVGALRASAVGAGSEWVGQGLLSTDPRVCAYTQAGVTGALPSPATPVTTVNLTQTPSVKVRAT